MHALAIGYTSLISPKTRTASDRIGHGFLCQFQAALLASAELGAQSLHCSTLKHRCRELMPEDSFGLVKIAVVTRCRMRR